MKKILCPFNLFDIDQKVYICTDDAEELIGTTRIADMANDLLKYGEIENTTLFHLIGNTTMANKIADDLKTNYCIKYGKVNEIEVKVN